MKCKDANIKYLPTFAMSNCTAHDNHRINAYEQTVASEMSCVRNYLNHKLILKTTNYYNTL